MRTVYLFNMMTLDGYFNGPEGIYDINWHHTDEEFNRFAREQLNSTGTILFGRITYEGMASYWPTPEAINDDPEVATLMNSIEKVVFSKTLTDVTWNNTRLIPENVITEIQKLKEQEGNDIAVFGSGNLIETLLQEGLVDELRVMVNPVLLGAGTPLFTRIGTSVELTLLSSRSFNNSNVLLTYRINR